jgi:SAM-dependent methyltransferase
MPVSRAEQSHPAFSRASGSDPGGARLQAPDRRRPARVRLLVSLFRRFPPKHTILKDPHPRPLREYEDERRFPFYRYFGLGPELFEEREVLDLGCGYGGRPVAYLEHGARSVTGVEVDTEIVQIASRFAAQRGAEALRFEQGSGEAIPLPNGSVDVITMNDVMEHVVSPAEVLAECWRVLRPAGRLAVVFPPYYDVTAGSHLHGYATSLPALTALFPTDALRQATIVVLDERYGAAWRRTLREVPTDKLWNLNGLTVRGFRRLVSGSRFTAERVRYIGHLDHRLSDLTGIGLAARLPVFILAEIPAQLPLVRELLCLRVCAILRK